MWRSRWRVLGARITVLFSGFTRLPPAPPVLSLLRLCAILAALLYTPFVARLGLVTRPSPSPCGSITAWLIHPPVEGIEQKSQDHKGHDPYGCAVTRILRALPFPSFKSFCSGYGIDVI